MKFPLAWHRLWAIVLKEFVQMRRDRITFAMMVGIPVMQLMLFGFAINTDPKRLPTVVFDASPSAYSRSFVASLENSGYFDVLTPPATVAEARRSHGRRRRPVHRVHPAGFFAAAGARRKTGAAAGGGCLRPGGDRQRDLRLEQPQPERPAA